MESITDETRGDNRALFVILFDVFHAACLKRPANPPPPRLQTPLPPPSPIIPTRPPTPPVQKQILILTVSYSQSIPESRPSLPARTLRTDAPAAGAASRTHPPLHYPRDLNRHLFHRFHRSTQQPMHARPHPLEDPG